MTATTTTGLSPDERARVLSTIAFALEAAKLGDAAGARAMLTELDTHYAAACVTANTTALAWAKGG